MPDDATPLLVSSPPPPERRTTLRVILALSAVLHLALLALFARSAPAPESARHDASETVRVLRGEVTAEGHEPGLRLHGYAEVAIPAATRP